MRICLCEIKGEIYSKSYSSWVNKFKQFKRGYFSEAPKCARKIHLKDEET